MPDQLEDHESGEDNGLIIVSPLSQIKEETPTTEPAVELKSLQKRNLFKAVAAASPGSAVSDDSDSSIKTPVLARKAPPLGPQLSQKGMMTLLSAKSRWTSKVKAKRKLSLNQAFSDDVEEELAVANHSMYWTRHRPLPMKDFHGETRSMKDIERFIANPVILFNPDLPSWEAIAKELIAEIKRVFPADIINGRTVVKCVLDPEDVYIIPDKIQGIGVQGAAPKTDQGTVTALGMTNALTDTYAAFCVFNKPRNLGTQMTDMKIICLVLGPKKEKETKSVLEVGRTFTTLLADWTVQRDLSRTKTADKFCDIMKACCDGKYSDHADENSKAMREAKEAQQVLYGTQAIKKAVTTKDKLKEFAKSVLPPGKNLVADVRRRLAVYKSDYTDGLKSWSSIQRMISAILFLFFAQILPGLALGVVMDENTHGALDSRRMILAQGFAGLVFSIFGGQPLGILRTTIPVVLFTKVIYTFAKDFHVDFLTFYFLTGIFNSIFMVIYALFGMSKILAYCSRSTEEIVGS